MPIVTYSRRFGDLATADPDAPAVTCGEETISRAELVRRADVLAADLAARGLRHGDMLTIALPNSVEWLVAVLAAWRVGAIPQPVSARLPARELAAIVELANAPVVLGIDPGLFEGRTSLPAGHRPSGTDEAIAALPDVDDTATASPAWKAPTSGGSTGRPKIIVAGEPALMDTDAELRFFIQRDGCMVIPGPLYHNGPFVWAILALLEGNHVVVLPRFDAEATLAAIDTHGGQVTIVVPTMMKRILRLPEEVRARYDLSSLVALWHTAEPCPAWLKRQWIDWIGPERVWEAFAGTEGQTATRISGAEWLAHEGSVGRPVEGAVRILDVDGHELPAGEMGEIWMRNLGDKPTYHYLGGESRVRDGDWESLGDLGRVDEDGYLYLGDRTGDLIISGGVNIYPAEVEAAIQEHPRVRSVAVIGLPDDDRGARVHAIVEADPGLDADGLRAFLADRLVIYKQPWTYEFVTTSLRDDAGKVRRGALRAERVATPAAS
ncbi:AMP-binding protein [Pseudonocardia ailaonensis]